MIVPFTYPLKRLSCLPIQRLYFNDPQVHLCHPTTSVNCFPDYKQISLQQSYFHKVLLSQQQHLQELLISKIAEQDTIIKSLTYYSQGHQEGSQKAKIEEMVSKTEEIGSETLDIDPVSLYSIQSTSFDSYKDAIIRILNYFLSHFGKVSRDEIEKFKGKYAHDIMLTKLLDVLIARYRATSKSREDMTRFVIRKSITWLRDQTRCRSHMTAKAASVRLCHKYFIKQATDLQNNKMLPNKDDELLSLLLPYKKNSRHPVVNSRFIKEIFSSREFCQDYLEYLTHYSEIMEQENEKKIRQFIDFVMACIQENCLHKILSYKRVPWLDQWIEASQGIGYEIYDLNACKGEDKDQIFIKQNKQIKTN